MNLAGLRADLRDEIDVGPEVTLVGTMTMVVVVLNSSHDAPVFLASVVALTAALVRPEVLHRAWWWLAMTAVLGTRILMAWEGVDNHVVLTAYWTLAIGLALMSGRSVATMARSGRWLVGLVFAFATGWKLAIPEFRSGAFFEFTLLVDDRFRLLATTVGGLSSDQYEANRSAFAAIGSLASTPAEVGLTSTAAIGALAVILTVGTIVIEALAAGVFLAPLAETRRWWRAATVVAFCVVTYLIVPVGGFGAVLVVMTIADPSLSRGWRRTLAVLFVAIGVYGVFWRLLVG